MKFLYLKGTEVLGPLEVEQLSKEECFSEELLVCPEEHGEEQEYWKIASDFPEFSAFLNNTANADVQQTEAKPQEEIKTENDSQDLPALEDTKTETDTDFKKDKAIPSEEGLIVANQTPSSVKDTFLDSYEDSTIEDIPAANLLGGKTEPKQEESQQNAKPLDHATPLKEEPLKPVESNNAILNNSFLEISNNKIISSTDGRVKTGKKNDLVFILSFVVIIVVAIALCMAFFNMLKDRDSKAAAESTVAQEQEEEVIQTPVQEIEPTIPQNNIVTEEPVAEEKTISLEDQAISIVKNTMLSGKGKTIDAYFKGIYGNDYKCSWSAKPFTSKTYIVEFFASQVRSEPFVYLFRVDIDKKEITGALNNITLDLLA